MDGSGRRRGRCSRRRTRVRPRPCLLYGAIFVDIDDWLEVLFSASLEDAWIRHIVFFKRHEHWVGMLAGKGRSTQRVLRAYFDFTRNAIVFPVPQSLDRAGPARA